MHWCYSIKAFARAETVERIHSVSNGLQEMGMLENKGFIWGFKPITYVIRGTGQKRMNYQNNSILIRLFLEYDKLSERYMYFFS